MATRHAQTVWLPKDSLLGVVLFIPLWGIGGLGWGLAMALFLSGGLIEWLFMGLLWGAFCWVFFSIFLLIAYRELSTHIPLQDAAMLPELLHKATNSLRYKVEEESPANLIYKPKLGLLRFLEFAKLHVRLFDGSVELIGPAIAVNKVRKQLMAAPR